MTSIPEFHGRLVLAATAGLVLASAPLIADAQVAQGLPQALNSGAGQVQVRGSARGGPQGQAPAPPPQVAVSPTPVDDLAQAFRAEVSAVTGEKTHMQVLLVQNYGWMRSTRTLNIGGEYKDGWMLTALSSDMAVLSKKGSPAKRIDLTRWTGPYPPATTNTFGGASNQPTRVTVGSLGMPTRASGASELTGSVDATQTQTTAAAAPPTGAGAAGGNIAGGPGASQTADLADPTAAAAPPDFAGGPPSPADQTLG